MTRPRQAHLLDYVACDLDRLLAVADAELESRYDGLVLGRQPVHTAYVPAHTFGPDTVAGWGAQALAALEEFAPGPDELACATGLAPGVAAEVYPLIRAKLATQPIEDLRIDFEDSYGARGDDTEDAHARAAARALATVLREDSAPPFSGLRCKSLEKGTRHRAVRTLQVFTETLLENGLPLPPGFVITLPKVTSAAQVSAMAVLCERLEVAYGIGLPRRLCFEIQVETPQAIIGADGAATIARCVHAGSGRLAGLHYGTYDYSAALGIAAAYQSMEHPAADYAKAVMQVAAAGTGVHLSDGSTNILPVGTQDEVIAAWRLHSRLVRRSLERGIYQGWDLHPAQLVTRYAATYAFYRENLPTAAGRLSRYAERASSGQEEPATARALAAFLTRALDCGALDEAELEALTTLTAEQLRSARRRGIIPERGP
ncbi:MAG TPA: aldolase/citrate lyase family protein [Streptosporangiaceae bacterium]|nr:aldolase/citrate lyase family protein [Streptosporangiaceae bacterium]